MPAFPREEIEDVMKNWIDANKEAERIGDWRIWPCSTPTMRPTGGCRAKEDVMCVGIDESVTSPWARRWRASRVEVPVRARID